MICFLQSGISLAEELRLPEPSFEHVNPYLPHADKHQLMEEMPIVLKCEPLNFNCSPCKQMPMTVDLDVWDNIREDKLVRQILCYLSGGLRRYPYILQHPWVRFRRGPEPCYSPFLSVLMSCCRFSNKGIKCPKNICKKKEGCIKKATS